MKHKMFAGAGRKVMAALLAIAMVLGAVPAMPREALADDPEKTISCLGMSMIEATNNQYSGSRVYFGLYRGDVLPWRVLANGTTEFSDGFERATVLLDCDEVLDANYYNQDSNNGSWLDSEIRRYLTIDENGQFCAIEGSAHGKFTPAERGAIAASFKAGEGNEALTGEELFVLSKNEVSGTGDVTGYYVYESGHAAKAMRTGIDGSKWWWLRSVIPESSSLMDPTPYVVKDDGRIGMAQLTDSIGVSPALNLDPTLVMFSTVVGESATTTDYMLTVLDGGLGASGTAALSGNTATISYETWASFEDAPYNEYENPEANNAQASYLITNAQWEEGVGWKCDYPTPTIYGYGRLGDFGKGTGTIGLPAECKPGEWGSAYHVYVMSEFLTAGVLTDYVGVPFEIELDQSEAYSVSVTSNPVEGGTASAEPATAKQGATVKLNATPAEGYEFAGWETKTPDVVIQDGRFTMPASDVAVRANFKKTGQPSYEEITLHGEGHVEGLGNVLADHLISKGVTIGTIGESRRLEAFLLRLPGDMGSIEYRAHLQQMGWVDWQKDGTWCGTTKEARRLEAVQIKLEGPVAESHSVWYRAHCQTWGWLGWAHDGEAAGTAGQAKRLEAIEVRVLPKGQVPSNYLKGQASYVGAVSADVHLQGSGWQGSQSALEFGTTGQSRRLEAVRLSVPNQPEEGGISYEAHLQGKGWMPAAADGQLAGTTGQSRRLEAVKVNLTGEMSKEYSVWYRVHSQTQGWLGWAQDGEVAGTTGLSKRGEAVEVQILPQGQVPKGYDASKPASITSP